MSERTHPPAETQLDSTPEQEVVPHISQRKKRKRGIGGENLDLNLTSMIDVIFQLLIYFIITANFQVDEAAILASLPGNSAEQSLEPPPITQVKIELLTTDEADGRTYTLLANNVKYDSVSQLAAYLKNQVKTRAMAANDIVEIKDHPKVRWMHTLDVYNACLRAKLTQVGIAP